jgi:Scavenger mRNA decapping enzyme C-term binding
MPYMLLSTVCACACVCICVVLGMDLNGLYVLGIVRQRGLHTLRDITGEHLPLLKEMYR